jgi:hypothetical protein
LGACLRRFLAIFRQVWAREIRRESNTTKVGSRTIEEAIKYFTLEVPHSKNSEDVKSKQRYGR